MTSEVVLSIGQGKALLDEGEELKNVTRLSTLHNSDFDYVMVFPGTKIEKAAHYKKKLIGQGKLIVKEEMSRDGDEIFFLITTTPRDFEVVAETIELKKLLKPEFHNAWVKFKIEKRDKFVLTEDGKLFTSYERATVIRHLIEESAGIDVVQKLETGDISKCFPLHEKAKIDYLLTTYIKKNWWKPVDKQIVDAIKDYFGTYIAIYFGWLLHYTRFLVIASIIGVIMFILEIAKTDWGVDNPASPFYAVFIAIWATVYIEFWKRRNAELKMEWDMSDYTAKEEVLPWFKGQERLGVYIDGVFVSLEDQAKDTHDKSPLVSSMSSTNLLATEKEVPKVLWAPENPKVAKMGVGLSVSLTFATVAIIGTLAVFMFKIFIHRVIATFGAIIGGIVNAVLIMILNMIYRKVAVKLTRWENHRTVAEYENTLISKNFLFQFVNSYVSLFYVAFLKGKVSLFGDSEYGLDTCKPNCMSELQIQLATIFLTQIFVQQFNEVAVPFIKQKVSLWMETNKMKRQQHLDTVIEASQAESESKLQEYDSTFEDYNEMAIQFGYVTLFAVAFPLAPLAALFNNFIEAKTDLLKLVKGMQRPRPKEAADIGSWLRILEIISYLAVVTNCSIIIWTSNALDKYDTDLDPNTHMSTYEKVIIGLALEHAILILKFFLSEFIPDAPGWVRETAAKKAYFKQLVLEDAVKHRRLHRQSVNLVHTEEQTTKPSVIALDDGY